IFCENHAALLSALQPGKASAVAAAWAWLTSSAFRNVRKRVLELRTAGKASVAIMMAEVEHAGNQARAWKTQSESGSLPSRVPESDRYRKACDALVADLGVLTAALPETDLAQCSVEKLGELLGRLAADTTTPYQIPKLNQVERELASAGAAKFAAEL